MSGPMKLDSLVVMGHSALKKTSKQQTNNSKDHILVHKDKVLLEPAWLWFPWSLPFLGLLISIFPPLMLKFSISF